MTSVVCAAAVSWHPSTEGEASALVLDPSEAESREGVGCGCFAFSFTTEISDPPQLSTSPGARLVWTNWHAKGGVFGQGELTRAQALGFAGAEAVWRAIKQSVPQMDGLPSLLPPGQPATEEPDRVAEDDDYIKVSEQESDDAFVEI